MEVWAVLGILLLLLGVGWVLSLANRRAGAAIEREMAYKRQQEARDEANVIARDVGRRADAAERLQDDFSR